LDGYFLCHQVLRLCALLPSYNVLVPCYLLAYSLYHVFFDKLAFYAASADNTAQTGQAGVGDWQEQIYQMVRHDINITFLALPFLEPT
jgi:hypothetical protein